MRLFETLSGEFKKRLQVNYKLRMVEITFCSSCLKKVENKASVRLCNNQRDWTPCLVCVSRHLACIVEKDEERKR